jgi:outer membrane biosynthesis protein TonB
MTAGASAARARPQAEVESHRPSLRLVAARPFTAARLPFAIFIGAILASGLVALLLLHTMAAQDAFRLQALQHESAALDDTEEQLAVANQQQAAPAALGARARALGMVPTGSIAYVDLHHHGKVVGVVRAAAPPPPPPTPSPSPSPSASAEAKKQSPQAQSAKKAVKKPADRRVRSAEHGRHGRLKP